MLNIECFKEFLTEADLDGDGNVNYEEFITLIFKVFLLAIQTWMSNKNIFSRNPNSRIEDKKRKTTAGLESRLTGQQVFDKQNKCLFYELEQILETFFTN